LRQECEQVRRHVRARVRVVPIRQRVKRPSGALNENKTDKVKTKLLIKEFKTCFVLLITLSVSLRCLCFDQAFSFKDLSVNVYFVALKNPVFYFFEQVFIGRIVLFLRF
jgi:hypothetical protein